MCIHTHAHARAHTHMYIVLYTSSTWVARKSDTRASTANSGQRLSAGVRARRAHVRGDLRYHEQDGPRACLALPIRLPAGTCGDCPVARFPHFVSGSSAVGSRGVGSHKRLWGPRRRRLDRRAMTQIVAPLMAVALRRKRHCWLSCCVQCVLAIIACSDGSGEGMSCTCPAKCMLKDCGSGGHAPVYRRHAISFWQACGVRMTLARSSEKMTARSIMATKEEGRGLARSAGVKRGWEPRLRGGADDSTDSGASAGAKGGPVRTGAEEAFFDALRQQEATFAEFCAPLPDDIVVVPDDEADARRAVAATRNGGCTYFAASQVAHVLATVTLYSTCTRTLTFQNFCTYFAASQEALRAGRGDGTGGEGMGGYGRQTVHSWGGVIEILHHRSVDLVSDTHTLLRGKWSLFPGSNGRFYGALLRYASTLASTLVPDECLLIAGGSPQKQILKGLIYSVLI